jgi:hypothetical protein
MAGLNAAGMATRGEAENVSRGRSDEASSGLRQPAQLGGLGALLLQNDVLVLVTQPISPDYSVASHHSVARDEQRYWITSEGRTNRADGARMSYLACYPGVGPDLATRDLESLSQHCLLELRKTSNIEL